MATIYLPVEARDGLTSEERANAINAEVWSLRRPDSVKQAGDVTKYYYGTITHPETGQVAIVGDGEEQIKIHEAVDMTEMIKLMPEVPEAEQQQLVAYIDANRGATLPFSTFVPSSSPQLTYEEADAAGWFQAEGEIFDEAEVVE